MMLPSLAALVVSGLALIWLGFVDPKRRRTQDLAAIGARRGVALAVLVAPGVALAATGAWAALLIWVGGAAIIGWTMAIMLAPRRIQGGHREN